MKSEEDIKSGIEDLDQVKQTIRNALDPAPGELGEMVGFLLERSGKMLRPRLLLISAALAGDGGRCSGNVLFETAAAVEMIHIASLVHDDIIDEAGQRRGEETLHLRRGPGPAVLVGDFLLARAFALLSRPGGDKNVLILLARTVSLLCLGEICQMNYQHRWELTEGQYYQVNYLKTAQFIGACCEAGGWISGAAPDRRRALRQFGIKVGQAFQIVDDILDYTGCPGQLGKPAGNDLEQGRTTLPLIHLFATQKQYLKLFAILPGNSARPAEIRKRLREAVKENRSLEYAAAAARQKQAEALDRLRQFPPSPERYLLTEIVTALTARLPAAQSTEPLI